MNTTQEPQVVVSPTEVETGSISPRSTPAPPHSEAAPEPVKIYTEVQCLPRQYFNSSLFKEDNTGTDKLKGLLTGLKKKIHDEYSETDCPDLMPGELARFYHGMHGDMDKLFVETPSPAIAFIYKSLGCPYSLQPQPYTTKFVEPTIPALKSEGWIIWTTIQLLLGPEEHSAFLIRAVEKWDVVDPVTSLTFPKHLPRDCFPAQPDKKMVAWYEGVSERLRKEAEEEAEEQRRQAAHAEQRRLPARRDDDLASVDSRGPALAYFRNPLYRHIDGRPSIVRIPARPPLSPRHSMMDKAKNGAAAVGSVIRNVANPHMWDGPSSSGSSRERERRRKSVPDNRYHHSAEPRSDGAPYNDRLPPPQRRRRSREDRPVSGSHSSWSSEDRSPRHDEPPRQERRRPGQSPSLRHSRSHDPTPTKRDNGDYFGEIQPRRGSAFEGADSLRPPNIGPSFVPSQSPLFAAQVAEYPSIERRGDAHPPPGRGPPRQYSPRREGRGPPRERSRPRSRPPPPDERHHQPRSRPQHDPRQHDVDLRERRGPPEYRSRSRPPSDDRPRSRPRPHRPRDPYDAEDDARGYDSPGPRPHSRSGQDRRSLGSDLDSGYSGPEDARRRRKQTRFAQDPPIQQGVDGRKFVEEAPWRS